MISDDLSQMLEKHLESFNESQKMVNNESARIIKEISAWAACNSDSLLIISSIENVLSYRKKVEIILNGLEDSYRMVLKKIGEDEIKGED